MSKKPLFIRLAQPTYGAFLLHHHHIKTIGMEFLTQVPPPFVIMGNHTHTFDPFLVSAASPVHIRWVAGAYLFKLFGLRPLLNRWIQAIPKQQGRSDLLTIRAISDALKQGDVVGIFPEGTRSWDGEPVGFDEAIAKLIKIFKVPVLIVNLEGFYGLRPRWARKARKGTATLRVLPPLLPEQIRSMSVSQLYAFLKEKLDFSYRSFQQTTPTPYKAKHCAEGVEQVLYLCPDCHAVSTIQSKDDTIFCTTCGCSMQLDHYDRLHTLKGTTVFEDVAAWHAWEREFLRTGSASSLVFPPDRGVLFQTGDATSLTTLSKQFTLVLGKEGLTIQLDDKSNRFLAFNAIQSMVINAKATLELYHENTLYRIRIQKTGCIIKYVEMYQASKGGII